MTVSKFINRDPNLFNCPFCGSIADFVSIEDGKNYGQIYCTNSSCFITTPSGSYEKCKAIWNNRVEFSQQLLEWL